MKRTFGTAILLLTLFVSASGISSVVFAAGTQLFISPEISSARQVGQSTNVILEVQESDTTAVKTQVAYDQTKLEYKGISVNGGSFSSVTVDTTTSGILSVDATGGTGTGARRVAVLTFTASHKGDAVVAFSGTNQIMVKNCILFLCSNTYKNVATSSEVTFSIAPASIVSPSTPAPRPTKHDTKQPTITDTTRPSTPSTTQEPSRQEHLTTFAIEKLLVSQVTSTAAVIDLHSTAPASGIVSITEYGKKQDRRTDLKEFSPTHSVIFSDLAPATRYEVRVELKNKAGDSQQVSALFTTLEAAIVAPIVPTDKPTLPVVQTISKTNTMTGLIAIIGILTVVGGGVVYGFVIARSSARLEASLLASHRHILRRFSHIK